MRRSVTLVILLLTVISMAAGQDVRYDFESVEVEYAASFTAVPADGNTSDWATRIAGGPGLPVVVTFGVVRLTNADGSSFVEGFLKVEGANGSMRFLANSGRALFSHNSTEPSGLASFFWSAKQLAGESVVKNFTKPIYAASLVRWFEGEEMRGIAFSTSDDGEAANDAFWHDPTPGNQWRVVLEDLLDVGDRRAI